MAYSPNVLLRAMLLPQAMVFAEALSAVQYPF
jgi:hypothetical protein